MNANITFDPSSGGIGMKLKIIRSRLIWTNNASVWMTMDGTSRVSVARMNRSGSAAIAASTKVDSGPATDNSASPRLQPSRFIGLTGVGLAQPNPIGAPDAAEPMKVSARSVPPTGSKWTIGLRVSRPNIFAVPSPSRYAASAWLNSWTGSPTRSMIATTMAAGMRVLGSRVKRAPSSTGSRVSYRPRRRERPDYRRARRSAFLLSYSSALIAPRSRRSARLASVRVTSSGALVRAGGAADAVAGGATDAAVVAVAAVVAPGPP